MKRIITIGFIVQFLFILKTYSQDPEQDPFEDMFSDETNYTTSTFKASRIINGHSIEQPAEGELEFRISHRFGKINGDAYELWGLDQATIHFSLEYSPINRLTVGVGRSNYQKTYDGYLKVKILQQQKGSRTIPVSLSYFGSSEIYTLKNEIAGFEWYHRVSYVNQLLIARKFNKRFSLQVIPTLVHHNLTEIKGESNNILALGLGGRFKLTNRLSINAEGFLVDHGTVPENKSYHPPISLGIDLETGGHVFQIMITNALPMRESAFITRTTGDWGNGDIHLGFNVSRMFHLHD